MTGHVDVDIEALMKDSQCKNTLQSTENFFKNLMKFMKSKGFDEIPPPEQFAPLLAKFMAGLRKSNGELLEPGSVRTVWFGIRRYLNSINYVDVSHDQRFDKVSTFVIYFTNTSTEGTSVLSMNIVVPDILSIV